MYRNKVLWILLVRFYDFMDYRASLALTFKRLDTNSNAPSDRHIRRQSSFQSHFGGFVSRYRIPDVVLCPPLSFALVGFFFLFVLLSPRRRFSLWTPRPGGRYCCILIAHTVLSRWLPSPYLISRPFYTTGWFCRSSDSCAALFRFPPDWSLRSWILCIYG